MVKRTSLNIDFELVARAREVLDTNGTTDTVHRALEEVVRRALRERMVKRTFDLSNEELDALRTPRTEGLPPVRVRRT